MDEPCPKLIALNPAGTKILLDKTDENKILLAQPCVCKYCEEGWTESLGSPIFAHCNTPRKAFVDFKDVVLCVYDPPCDPALPAPPNGHPFEVVRQDYAWLGHTRCCWWWGQETIDSIAWQVVWGIHYLNGFHPPETRLYLLTDSISGVSVAMYFNTYMDIDSEVTPCMPANGGWLSNDLDCPGGNCAVILPATGIAAHQGQGRVQW